MISVVVAIYNIEEYIGKCIDSIIGQTFRELEIILVDDGSTDSSGEICEKYAKSDNRIRVIHQKNAGLSAARNTGMKEAGGEYITFIDGDDYVHPQMIEILYKNIGNTGASISIGNYKEVNCAETIAVESLSGQAVTCAGRDSCFNLYNEQSVMFTTAWGKLYLISLFDDVKYPVGKIHEDEYVTYQLLYNSKFIVYTDDILYYYVQRKESITHEKYDEKNLTLLEMADQVVQFYHKKSDAELKQLAVERALWIGRNLYRRYLPVQKECRKKVLKKYRLYLKKYGYLLSKRARTAGFMFVIAPWAERKSEKVIAFICKLKDDIFA